MNKQKISIFILLITLNLVICQRSPYAGSRPIGYKDHYLSRPTENETNLANRFGEGTLDLNATQRPPLQGVIIVFGEPATSNIGVGNVQISSPTAIQTPAQFPNISNTQNQTQLNFIPFGVPQQMPLNTLENRFGQTNASTNNLIPGTGTGGAVQPIGTIQPNRLPYDALGDQELVNRLNRLPEEQKPFWLLNYQAIEAHRNSSGNQPLGVASRSSFLGK